VSAIIRVRATSRRRALLAALLWPWACPWTLQAEPAHPQLTIEVAEALALGPTRLEVVVDPGDSREQPLMLDVASEGEAVQVVRGRFLRADAQREPSGRLRFAVPILVRAQGTAHVRAELRTYRCAPDCREVRSSAQRVLTIGPGAGRPDTAP
jgi:hypothetical protein